VTDVTSYAEKKNFLPTAEDDKITHSVSFFHVVMEIRGRVAMSVPYGDPQKPGPASVFDPSPTEVSFTSCAIQPAVENKLCPSVSFSNLNLSLIKCKVRLGAWFVEGVVGNQIPVPMTCERVGITIRHCDLVEGKIKMEAISCLEMDDCWSMCFPMQLTGQSKADIQACQFVNAGDIRFHGSRDAITVHKSSSVDVTDCQFEAYGIALCVKHRHTSLSAVRNVFKVCNTVALASTLCRIEMIENIGKGSGCLLVAIEKAESKLIGNDGDFKPDDYVQVDEETEDPIGDVEEVSVIPQEEVRGRQRARQAANICFGKSCNHCAVIEGATTDEELRRRNGFAPDVPVFPDALITCTNCQHARYCSPACLEQDAVDHAFVCQQRAN